MRGDSRREYARVKNMLLGSMILLPLLPLVLILGIGYYYFTTSVEQSTAESMKRIMTDHGLTIERFLHERQADLEFLLDTHPFEELRNTERLGHILAILQRRSPAFADLGVFNDEGLHVAYHGAYPLVGRIYKDAGWFQEVMVKPSYISNFFPGFRKEPHFIIAIARHEGGRRWVLRATIDTPFFNDLVKKVRIGRTGEAYVMSADGILQTDRRSGGRLMEPSPDRHLIPPGDGTVQSFITRDETGLKYLYSTLNLKGGQWRLIVRREVADAFAELRAAGYLIILIMAVGGAAITLSAVSLTRLILRRMEAAEQHQRQLNEQLVRASRLAELGQMAAGVAHEINNPLQIIKSEHYLIEMDLEELKASGVLPADATMAEIEESLAQIKKQVARCADITQSVLKFGRQSTPRIELLSLQSFIPEVIHMVAKNASVHGIQVQQRLAEDLPTVNADAAQLQQVLLNLLNNAVDAILERHGVDGGRLSVNAQATADGKVAVQVTDNGTGIKPADTHKIFTPFFTTKPVGKGTGLGLSVCYGLIDQMGGAMTVASRKDIGTTFTIELPAADTPGEGLCDDAPLDGGRAGNPPSDPEL
ncbi:MAG: sensor histidine kinase [Desulfobacteraceae bacterium]|nr:MAG: sensor histidine kinase [Desulfobacteraceae bacterium]